jgi:hypothetical protein
MGCSGRRLSPSAISLLPQRTRSLVSAGNGRNGPRFCNELTLARGYMSDHKFAVGQNVEFSPDWPIDDTTKGQYTIVALYPETGNIPQYRIKSKRDGHERMVQEDRLDRLLNSVPTKNSFAAMFNRLR